MTTHPDIIAVLEGRSRWCVVVGRGILCVMKKPNRISNWSGPCEQCGVVFSKYHRACHPFPRFCTPTCRNRATAVLPHVQAIRSASHKGPRNKWWKGEAVSVKGGRTRAQRAFPIVRACEACGEDKKRIDRHHKDGNTKNNSPENIAFFCRRCHMTVDGRLAALPNQMRALQPKGVAASAVRRRSNAR